MLNLLQNALKFTREGEITIELSIHNSISQNNN